MAVRRGWFHVLSVALLVVLCPASLHASDLEFAAGLGALEEGDDRPRSSIVAQVGWNKIYVGRLYFAQRKMGPVTDQTIILAGIRRWTMFKVPYLRADVGPVIMNESFQIDFASEGDQAFNRNEDNFNIGALVGLTFNLPSNRLLFEFSWNSHLFPAGIAGLFLASGRKQTLSLTLGVKI